MDTPAVTLGPSLAVKTQYGFTLTSGRLGIHFVLQSQDPLTYHAASLNFTLVFLETAFPDRHRPLHLDQDTGVLTLTLSSQEALAQPSTTSTLIKQVAFNRRRSIQEGSFSCNYKRNPRSTRARCSLPVGHDGNHSYRER